MLLINITCNESFSRVGKNRRDIAEKGWEQYNRTFLTFSHIRTTMIDSDYLKGVMYYVGLSPSSPVSNITNNLVSDKLFPSISECGNSGGFI